MSGYCRDCDEYRCRCPSMSLDDILQDMDCRISKLEKIVCSRETVLYKEICEEIDRMGEEVISKCSSVDREYILLYTIRRNLDRNLSSPVFQCLVNKLRLQ